MIETYSPLARGDKQLLKSELVGNIAKAHGKSPAQVAIRWALDQGFIVIPKSKHLDRVRMNMQVTDFSLSEEEVQQVHSLTKANVRTCWDPSKIMH